jgi:hypothetical protein
MKKHFTPLLIICLLTISLVGQNNSSKKSSTPDIGNKIFNALKADNETEFLKLIPTKQEFVGFLVSKIDSNKRAERRLELEKSNEVDQELDKIIKQYQRAIGRGKELGIDWRKIVLQNVSYETSSFKGTTVINGEIYFKEKQNNYIIKFSNSLVLKNRTVATNLFTPYTNTAPLNQAKCRSLKDQYIKNCVISVKQSPVKPTIPIEEYCLCSFNKVILEDNCEKMINSKPVTIIDGGCFK